MTPDNRLEQRGRELLRLGRVARRLGEAGREEEESFVHAMIHAGTMDVPMPKSAVTRLRSLVDEVEGVQ